MANEIQLKGVVRGVLPSFLKQGGDYSFAPVETAPNKNFRIIKGYDVYVDTGIAGLKDDPHARAKATESTRQALVALPERN